MKSKNTYEIWIQSEWAIAQKLTVTNKIQWQICWVTEVRKITRAASLSEKFERKLKTRSNKTEN